MTGLLGGQLTTEMYGGKKKVLMGSGPVVLLAVHFSEVSKRSHSRGRWEEIRS